MYKSIVCLLPIIGYIWQSIRKLIIYLCKLPNARTGIKLKQSNGREKIARFFDCYGESILQVANTASFS